MLLNGTLSQLRISSAKHALCNHCLRYLPTFKLILFIRYLSICKLAIVQVETEISSQRLTLLDGLQIAYQPGQQKLQGDKIETSNQANQTIQSIGLRDQLHIIPARYHT